MSQQLGSSLYQRVELRLVRRSGLLRRRRGHIGRNRLGLVVVAEFAVAVIGLVAVAAVLAGLVVPVAAGLAGLVVAGAAVLAGLVVAAEKETS